MSIKTCLAWAVRVQVGLGSRRTVLSFDCRLVALLSSSIPRRWWQTCTFVRGCPQRNCPYFQQSAGSCFLPVPKEQGGGNAICYHPQFSLQAHVPGTSPCRTKLKVHCFLCCCPGARHTYCPVLSLALPLCKICAKGRFF